MKTAKMTVTALLLSFSFVLSILESFVPVSALIPIPGLKLGLANIAVSFAYFFCGKGTAFLVVILRPTLSLLLFGNPTSFFLSLCGGAVSFCGLLASSKGYMRLYTFGGVSVICAVLHAVGQIVAASVIMYDMWIFTYLPLLCAASAVTGLLNGFIMNLLFDRLDFLGRFFENEKK